MPVPVALVAVGAAQGVYSAIQNTIDAPKRRLYEQNLALLSTEEKRKLNEAVLNANSEQARQQLLQQTLGQIGQARVEGLVKVQTEREKTRKVVIITSIILGVLLIGGVFIILYKKNK